MPQTAEDEAAVPIDRDEEACELLTLGHFRYRTSGLPDETEVHILDKTGVSVADVSLCLVWDHHESGEVRPVCVSLMKREER